MIDKKLEENIKNTKRFLEFWSKFQELYRIVISGSPSLKDKEEGFTSTRTLVNTRFQELMDSLGVSHGERLKRAIPIYEILSIENLYNMSDEKLKKIEDHWTDSYIFLSSILDRFQKKKKRIEDYSKVMFVTKSFLRRMKLV